MVEKTILDNQVAEYSAHMYGWLVNEKLEKIGMGFSKETKKSLESAEVFYGKWDERFIVNAATIACMIFGW